MPLVKVSDMVASSLLGQGMIGRWGGKLLDGDQELLMVLVGYQLPTKLIAQKPKV